MPLEPLFAKICKGGRTVVVERATLTEEEKRVLDASFDGVLRVKRARSPSPKSSSSSGTPSPPPPPPIHLRLRYRVRLCSESFGVSKNTICKAKTKKKVEKLPQVPEKYRILNLLSEEQKEFIKSEIELHYETDTNFTLKTFLKKIQEKIAFPYGRTTLFKILKALDFSYRTKTYNPFASERKDVIFLRKRYLDKIQYHRERGDYIVYFDETWIFHGMSRRRGWLHKYGNAYEIARMGNLKNPIPGFPATSDKGIRAIVLAVMTESGILPGSIDVIVSGRPADEQVIDYHKTMTAESYGQYMDVVLPLILAACPAGRRPVLVIDNASIHNKLVQKVAAKAWKKGDIVTWLADQGVVVDQEQTKEAIWKEAVDYMATQGGAKAMRKFEVDEKAKGLGISIVRLPPYHCCFNPIELIWGMLKSKLLEIGHTKDSILQGKCLGSPIWKFLKI
uniref:DDE_3 domain-containing protein n=1 Tax=Caenorhabditis japonica TaxID=281687 RepID=A0A8R1HY40_CAEJA